MPKDVTTNVQLQQLANRMRIPYFRCIFMRTILSRGVHRNESGIWIMLRDRILMGGICKKGESRNLFRQFFWQFSTAERINTIFRK